ncbi:3-oxoacyl-[acyl-carrier-protein] synthase 3 [Aquisphaera giovannonii]|uniref:Beta-ketoacyl-[acyl-carrier-protein] synthase III n=1 Tax=Aquisphaera giovannonii TaxID=406548 RepID=A0A5B9W6V6_9BACT|nr:beta-ketoacyl-ACP synthase III [Aquisphaera giovannonii]QEH36343.1 3-oxoacyl-[acyl-carrier-protein] synthase 3 [Aquisphaera giovannonii]
MSEPFVNTAASPVAHEERRVLPISNGQSHIVPRTLTLTGVQVLGTGSYVPENVVSNVDLQDSLGFDPEWIVNRTGIHERRFALPHQATSDLCAQAASRCLKAADCRPSDVDLLVLATFTPDMAFPSTGNLVQDRLKLNCPAFDIQAACAGFVFALVIGSQFVATGNCKRVLVVGGDCNSRVINPGDQKSFPLFGDGAGAVLLGPGTKEQGMIAYQLGSDGSGSDLLTRPAGGSRMPPSCETVEQGLHYLTMDGRAIFKWAVRILADSTLAVLGHAGSKVPDVRWFIPHQANVRIIHAASDVLGFPREAVFKNLERYGNTSAGSVPIALDEVHATGTIRHGDQVLFSGFGSGLNWGTVLWRW